MYTKAIVILLIVIVLGLALYAMYMGSSKSPYPDTMERFDTSQPMPTPQTQMAQTPKVYSPNSVHSTCSEDYKRSNYVNGRRDQQGVAELDDYFEMSENVIGPHDDNDNFAPMEKSCNKYAIFPPQSNSGQKEVCGSNQNCSPDELYDADKYLPQEINKDWFEVPAEPVSVKNRHLVNVIRPFGIDTIVSSKKGAGQDLRGTIPNPKTVVAPWLNSSIEPDFNIVSFCN